MGLVALLQAFGLRLDQQRLPEGCAKSIVLRSIKRTQDVLFWAVRSRSCGSLPRASRVL